MPYYVFGNGTIVTPEWLNDIQTRIYNPDTGEYRQWLDADLSDSPGQIKDRVAALNNELKITSITGLYANYKGGQIRNILGNPITIPDGSVLCADNTTNYVCVDKNGTVFISTAATKLTLARVVLSSGQLVSLTDLRAKYLVFDPSDVQTVITSKSNSFTAENNGFYIITPSTNITITLPTNLDSCRFNLIVLPNAYIVKTNETATVNGATTSYVLNSGKLYGFVLTVNGWYCYSVFLDGQLDTTDLNDMPSNLIAGKLLKVNLAGTKYELADAKSDNWSVKNSNYLASNNERILTTQAAPVTISLPGSPETGSFIEIYGDFSTNNATINRNGNTINGGVNQVTLSTANTLARFIYSGATWINNTGTSSSETAQGTSGQQGTVTSLYTSTLISDASYGSCAVINANTNLCLIAYRTNNNTTKIMPAIFNSGSLIFTFYKSVEWAESARDIKIMRVSDTQGIVSYYLPDSDTVTIKLIEVSTLGCVVKSYANITSATMPRSGWFSSYGTNNQYYEVYTINYSSNQICVQTISQIKILQITNNILSVLYQTSTYDGANSFGYGPGSSIFFGNCWYISYLTTYWGNTSFQHIWPNICIINTSGNLIFSSQKTQSDPSFLFQNKTSLSLIAYYSFALYTTGSWNYCYPRTLSNSSPYFTGSNTPGSGTIYPTIGNEPTNYGIRASQTGNVIWLMNSTGTKVATGFINSNGILSMSNFSNLLGLSTPSATFGYFGVISDTQFGIVSNGFVAIANA